MRAAGLPAKKQADGQTNQELMGKNPVIPGLPPTIRLHKRSEGSRVVNVCRRMLSVFRFTLAPWVSRHIRKLDGLALRAGKDFRDVARRFSVRFLVPFRLWFSSEELSPQRLSPASRWESFHRRAL